MITENQITRHLDALNALHKKLDKTKYKKLGMTKIRRKFKIQAHTFKAMCELKYIERSGENKGATWKWGHRPAPQPHDARRVLEIGLEIKNLKQNEGIKIPAIKTKSKRIAKSKFSMDKTTIVPVKKEAIKKYVAAEVKPIKLLIVEEESKSILWGLYKYTKIKRK